MKGRRSSILAADMCLATPRMASFPSVSPSCSIFHSWGLSIMHAPLPVLRHLFCQSLGCLADTQSQSTDLPCCRDSAMCRRAIPAAAARIQEAVPRNHASAAGGLCAVLHAHHPGLCQLVWRSPGVTPGSSNHLVRFSL